MDIHSTELQPDFLARNSFHTPGGSASYTVSYTAMFHTLKNTSLFPLMAEYTHNGWNAREFARYFPRNTLNSYTLHPHYVNALPSWPGLFTEYPRAPSQTSKSGGIAENLQLRLYLSQRNFQITLMFHVLPRFPLKMHFYLLHTHDY